jgi:hypothetical protein
MQIIYSVRTQHEFGIARERDPCQADSNYAEPRSLRKCRRRHQERYRVGLVPPTVVITGNHVKTISPGRQLGVERKRTRSGIDELSAV